METIIISLLLAFVLSGISQVMKDLGESPINRPGWAMRPTVGGAFMVAISWFSRPFIDAFYSNGQLGRAIASGLLGVLTQLSVLTIFFWGAITLTGNYIDSTILQVIVVGAILVFGAPIILPIASILIIPITLIVAFPIDFVFPLKESKEAKEVVWCKNCKHHKKSKKFEDTISGLWRSEEMPDEELLPCEIACEAADTWSDYFETTPSNRSLYPKDCEYFERK
ncbi:hypothetical protein GO003_022600 [Methylicorpusculum oleiharenae]|uniref:hypothetical protein n=1 Tax=Methylicorpusculum oleiharenae TaxID=1338687 RepID=UPI001358F0BD|nr:hypothetical protein [Methylicorpusculum oleiharenae]MCD2453177.1 hypothetical protein [Methylicorpusculum oleiharenae]